MELPSQFSEREKAVIELLLQGKSNKQIALSLGVTNRTVEFHLGNIFAKLGVMSRSEAILMITNYNPGSFNRSVVDDLRESTVVSPPEVGDNVEKPLRRIPMKKSKYVFIGLGLLACLLIIYFIFPKIWIGNSKMLEATPSLDTAVTITSSPLPSQEQSVLTDDNYTFTQTVNSTEIKLILNWFYVDSSRVNLEVTVCGLPIPNDFKPIFIIDPGKIALSKTDGSPIELVQHINFGGGSGGEEEKPSADKVACYRQTFDYFLKDSQPAISQEDSYILDIPVGGSITSDTGEVKSISSTVFHLEVKPTYSGSLTFVTQKTAFIENKTITFKGLEVNPSSATVILCVFDPLGEQWLPNVELLYKGNIFYTSNGGLVDNSNEDPSKEMCYRINYSYSFQLDTTDEPRADLSVLVAKLTKDQPERLSYQLIAHAQNKLATEGIEFGYVILNHGSNITITKKPEGLTEAEALQKVQDSLVEDAVSSDVIVFDLK